MMSLNLFKNKSKFALLLFCFNTTLYGVSNKDLPNMGHEANSPLMKVPPLFSQYAYKGIFPLNSNEWYITRKWRQPLEYFINDEQIIPIVYYIPHPNLNFAIFKLDTRKNENNSQNLSKTSGLGYTR